MLLGGPWASTDGATRTYQADLWTRRRPKMIQDLFNALADGKPYVQAGDLQAAWSAEVEREAGWTQAQHGHMIMQMQPDLADSADDDPEVTASNYSPACCRIMGLLHYLTLYV